MENDSQIWFRHRHPLISCPYVKLVLQWDWISLGSLGARVDPYNVLWLVWIIGFGFQIIRNRFGRKNFIIETLSWKSWPCLTFVNLTSKWSFDGFVRSGWWFWTRAYARICIWMFLERSDTNWRKLEIRRFGKFISLTQSSLCLYRIHIMVPGIGIASLCHLGLVCKNLGLFRVDLICFGTSFGSWMFKVHSSLIWSEIRHFDVVMCDLRPQVGLC